MANIEVISLRFISLQATHLHTLEWENIIQFDDCKPFLFITQANLKGVAESRYNEVLL